MEVLKELEFSCVSLACALIDIPFLARPKSLLIPVQEMSRNQEGRGVYFRAQSRWAARRGESKSTIRGFL
jgi:hypothetical protein